MGSGFEPIDPNSEHPDRQRTSEGTLSTDPSTKKPSKRVVGTPDAIHLTTCLHIRDVLGLSDIVFHTFDDGKGKTWEGKCLPLLSFETWFPAGNRTSYVENVCGLSRTLPNHPQPDMLGAN